MMIESVPAGSIIGMGIPIGYETVLVSLCPFLGDTVTLFVVSII